MHKLYYRDPTVNTLLRNVLVQFPQTVYKIHSSGKKISCESHKIFHSKDSGRRTITNQNKTNKTKVVAVIVCFF